MTYIKKKGKEKNPFWNRKLNRKNYRKFRKIGAILTDYFCSF